IWDGSGALMATQDFISETGGGWQQVNLESPVYLNAYQIYTVSFYSSNGYAARDQYAFSSQGLDRGPLHAPRDYFEGGNNGLYLWLGYPGWGNCSSGFSCAPPSVTSDSTSYWADVVFQPQ